ncbi:unnamed protein product [Linum tenue]|uniref:Uncharacterized protein n=1 Tax=Linum tenue TaxID=586396 RepID=A0AAV0HII7_9ROSI|nr:unnamed protein product [Linum tenue]
MDHHSRIMLLLVLFLSVLTNGSAVVVSQKTSYEDSSTTKPLYKRIPPSAPHPIINPPLLRRPPKSLHKKNLPLPPVAVSGKATTTKNVEDVKNHNDHLVSNDKH